MSERNWQKEYEDAMTSLRVANANAERLRTAVRLAARMDKPTDAEVENLIRMASGY